MNNKNNKNNNDDDGGNDELKKKSTNSKQEGNYSRQRRSADRETETLLVGKIPSLDHQVSREPDGLAVATPPTSRVARQTTATTIPASRRISGLTLVVPPQEEEDYNNDEEEKREVQQQPFTPTQNYKTDEDQQRQQQGRSEKTGIPKPTAARRSSQGLQSHTSGVVTTPTRTRTSQLSPPSSSLVAEKTRLAYRRRAGGSGTNNDKAVEPNPSGATMSLAEEKNRLAYRRRAAGGSGTNNQETTLTTAEPEATQSPTSLAAEKNRLAQRRRGGGSATNDEPTAVEGGETTQLRVPPSSMTAIKARLANRDQGNNEKAAAATNTETTTEIRNPPGTSVIVNEKLRIANRRRDVGSGTNTNNNNNDEAANQTADPTSGNQPSSNELRREERDQLSFLPDHFQSQPGAYAEYPTFYDQQHSQYGASEGSINHSHNSNNTPILTTPLEAEIVPDEDDIFNASAAPTTGGTAASTTIIVDATKETNWWQQNRWCIVIGVVVCATIIGVSTYFGVTASPSQNAFQVCQDIPTTARQEQLSCTINVALACTDENCPNVQQVFLDAPPTCNDEPTNIIFRYTGQSCDQSTTPQPSPLFDCSDFGPPQQNLTDNNNVTQAWIRVTDESNLFQSNGIVFFEGFVKLGDSFALDIPERSTVGPGLNISLYENENATNFFKTITFESSCNDRSPLTLLEEFGGIQILEIENENQGLLSAFQRVAFVTSITNSARCNLTLSNISHINTNNNIVEENNLLIPANLSDAMNDDDSNSTITIAPQETIEIQSEVLFDRSMPLPTLITIGNETELDILDFTLSTLVSVASPVSECMGQSNSATVMAGTPLALAIERQRNV